MVAWMDGSMEILNTVCGSLFDSSIFSVLAIIDR